ncbi:MAG: hypothetical protein K9M54_04665 [Kiritimatiellales bacterium]|nr:hypothetical protein [Kiritimatiellales bacterium]MCF7864823.1 hypothetical protein [Kiritimatiellales bacterium]
MKRLLISLVALCALAAPGQEEAAVPPGVPARLEVANGKVVKVFLQSCAGSNITFRVLNSDKDITTDPAKIKSLTFYPKYDAAATEQSFNGGDYPAVLATLAPVMEPFMDYMSVSNNMQPAFCMLLDAYRESGDWTQVRESAAVLMATGNPALVIKGQIDTALAALAAGDVSAAETLRAAVDSEAAGLYLQACIERARQEPKTAIQTATDVIAKHGNDMDWLPSTELLCTRLYLDMAMTNSADSTARQVQKLYAGTHIAKDAERLRSGLVRTTDETKENGEE